MIIFSPIPIMAKYFTLVPLPEDIFSEVSLVDRVVFVLIWERYKLSSYKVTGGSDEWVDDLDGSIFCIFSHDELARKAGVSEKTVRRSLVALRDEHGLIDWRKASFKGACRYYVEKTAREYMTACAQDNRKEQDSQ